MEDVTLSWPGSMTTHQAKKYLLTSGFVAIELFHHVSSQVSKLKFQTGIPEKDGYYLVRLVPGHCGSHDQRYDVDYCRSNSASDGGGRTWATWYPHNVEAWAELPDDNGGE